MSKSFRVAIIDDHPLFLDGLASMLASINGIEVVGRGATAADAIKIAQFDANTWNIFAYEKGGMMPGGKAPAKRVGFFWHRPSGGTAEGKKLFQAAVGWLIAP